MSKYHEIWFFKGAPAARLVSALGRRYSLRTADRPERRGQLAAPAGPAVWFADPEGHSVAALRRLARRQPQLRLIAVVTAKAARTLVGREWFACLPRNADPAVVRRSVESAFANIALAERERQAREDLVRAEHEQEALNRIGVALSATHDVGVLLETILAKTREITGADAGSLYVLETERSSNGASAKSHRHLRFQLTQNDSRDFVFTEFTLPINKDSITGYAAMRGEVIALDDAYDIPPDRPYRFNARYDRQTAYKTRSLLTVPMKNARGEVIGVVQLLNCKRNRSARLLTAADIEREVQPFPARAIRLAESLASQAAVAYENSRLYQDIESLFEGFVQAAVTAIEQRDPTTSGHSLRVSRMTVGLAEIVDRSAGGSYRALHFTRDQMKEIRYAALLHDFGKVGVREEVLVKAKKLYPAQFDVVQGRFDYVHKEMEARCEREKFRALLELPRDEALGKIAALDEEFRRSSRELDDAFAVIVESNEPTVLVSSQFERLFDVARQTFLDPRGVQRPLLTAEETRFLSIPRGSLDQQERHQIESHVVHSFNFLMQIPWTQTIHEIPEIVRAHHEKMNGTGYPYRLRGQEIPVQARMMTICDIFDALSSSDRPYKKAVPPERALAILEDAVGNKELDSELFQLFLEGRVYELLDKAS
jgi:HD-GYP domain-containing protein (c-di-GMP phosphodiesterase class II)